MPHKVVKKNRESLFTHRQLEQPVISRRKLHNEDAHLKSEWTTPTRVRVKTLQECGNTRRQIFEKTNVPERTQRLWLKKPDRRSGKNRPGARKKLTQSTIRQIIRYISKSFENRQATWQDLADTFGDGCAGNTVKEALKPFGYRKCKACQKTWLTEDNVAARKAFCDVYQHKTMQFWHSVRFTDEVHFALESRKAAVVIRNECKAWCDTCYQYRKRSRGSQIHCWGMVGYGYKSDIVFFDANDSSEPTAWIYEALAAEHDDPQPTVGTEEEERQLLGDACPSTCRHACRDKSSCKHACCKPNSGPTRSAGNLTMVQYLSKIFRPYIEPAWREAKSKHHAFVLLEDNDGSHGTKSETNIVARYKAQLNARKGFKWYANAPKSPDLNIIENVWRILKQRVKQRKCTSIEGIKVAIKEEWDGIEQQKINELVDSMPSRIQCCKKNKGLHTPW